MVESNSLSIIGVSWTLSKIGLKHLLRLLKISKLMLAFWSVVSFLFRRWSAFGLVVWSVVDWGCFAFLLVSGQFYFRK